MGARTYAQPSRHLGDEETDLPQEQKEIVVKTAKYLLKTPYHQPECAEPEMTTPVFALGQTTLNSIRSLPPDTYLIHATNCIAEWGAGIAAELATVFPAACKEYKSFCNAAKADASERWPPRSLAGRCLIIPPQPADVAGGAPSIHIVCLFTSYGYGRPGTVTGKPGKDSMGMILRQTEKALKDLKTQLEPEGDTNEKKDVVIYSPMFNSGAFRVPWEKTRQLIEKEFEGWDGQWLVMAPPS